MSLGTKKPKFKLDLNINELSNIPQVSGECYIELNIRDSKKKSLPSLRALSIRNNIHKSLTDNDNSEPSSGSSTPAFSSPNSEDNRTHTSNGNIYVTTSSKPIHNFKCGFNYKVSCNLRFGIKRRENLIADKYLLMKIFYVGEKHKEFGHHHTSNRLELGKLEINLAEYLNFNEPVTSKYLLKDSKVNSILSLTVHLSELPASFDFHTSLQINDSGTVSKSVTHHDTTSKSSSTAQSSSHNQYNVPQFERRNIFGGLNDVIGSENKKTDTSIKREQSPMSDDRRIQRSGTKKSRNPPEKSLETKGDQDPPVLIDPIVNDLYKKILESTWDPKLHLLLDFSPEVCINSIFNNSADEWRQKLKDDLADDNDEDEEVRCIHGLINETNYREDLRSWSVKGVN
ncbi:hypothetical protein PSN45_000922 [Yamadazyma tenuis]|uniref:C2 NT-type domain-containing protein n=1 Tax=Candida tenuis (strain ATCC 10573 / BCRC 21748 / CBS 615 / JCM 9827 / NBRC 10315 / NRRL Y-1498 / VKM Y-70) TaxID=590646 RepID=G3BBP4_CANTC|nr:uncharacterized protein CANTEDRAFT_107537 [Yamadazyma tenuis ATCC 10573]EGV62202.1 hypothetical protein CANTEDRAFT_107537 [Yamadazyma tenuis ATCC 10573]WEJ93459.1 hypothetical protein PSN45_000922 [Yamadazyma tenuis]